ncbi:MAG: hypothetical protein COT73_05110 [Bdellovibrio sp. CG10_big_fil_rev_8_21_14_0_10_47_8]|nr:MAG: hypothetical protein COT73_05110 [Bdellovibrio sp. CG10_big_fil_rev_8_21_14_0_10_47_8]
MGLNINILQIALAIGLLSFGVVGDLRSKKVPNQFVLISAGTAIIFVLVTQGLPGLLVSVLSLMAGAILILPLYLMKAIGGGDLKLFLAVSLLMTWQGVLISVFGALVWGSLLGIFQVALKGEIKAFLHNLLALFQRVKLQETKTHKIPFTVALLLGYLTSLVWGGTL